MASSITDKIIMAMQKALPADREFIPLHEPSFDGNELKYVSECIETGWVSSVGKFVDRFEEMLAEFTGAKKAVAAVNGTAALHICLILAGVEQDDEIIIPSLTFIATANAVSYCKAIPHLVDSDMTSLGLDPVKLADYLEDIVVMKGGKAYNRHTNRRLSAIVPMHTFGHPVDMDPLMEVANRYNIAVVEDAAESLGSYYKGTHTGNQGLVASLSFNGNKTITTGGGGAIITNDEKLGKLAKHLTTTARIKHQWEFYHDMVGYNYRLPNLNAALGVAQMENLAHLLSNKRKVMERYKAAFAEVQEVKFMTEPSYGHSNFWLNAIVVGENNPGLRDEILTETNAKGLMTRPCWTLMHRLPMYTSVPRMPELTVAESIESRLINIPSSPNLA